MLKLILAFLCLFYSQGFLHECKKKHVQDQSEYLEFSEQNLKFEVYTRKNVNAGRPISIGNKSLLLASGFNGSLPTKICTHGFMDHAKSGWIRRLKEELLKTELNFITVDWSECAKNVFYEQAVVCTKKAGRSTGELLKFLQQEGNLKPRDAHLIGHSLGAQLIGFASDAFSTKQAIGRMTGLDPAGPLFEHVEESERLNPKSAKFVDVIHTCRFFTGMKKPVGTVDFYPNGGFHQPGCSDFDLACHHSRSHRYFIDTIDEKRKKKYVAKKCATLEDAFNGTCSGESAVMGYYSQESAPGIYYLKITSVPAV